MTKPAPNAAPPAKISSKAGGRFQKGRSGNPAGKKKGTRSRKTVLIETLLANIDVAAILAKMEKKAKAGSETAAKLLLDRVAPVRRGSPVRFPLPSIKTTADVVSALAAVTAAMASGHLSPAEAVEVASVVELQRRAIETQEIEVRLHALEARFT